MEDKRPRGRPRATEPLAKVRGIRFTEAEDALVEAAAEADGKNVASWIREKAVAAAKRRR